MKESELLGLATGGAPTDITSIVSRFTDASNTDTEVEYSVSTPNTIVSDEAILGLFGGIFDDSYNLSNPYQFVDADGDDAVQFNVAKA